MKPEEKKKKKLIELDNQAYAHLVAKEYEEAIKVCDRILEIDLKRYKAQINKGNALYDLEKYEEAIACYDSIPTRDKQNYFDAQCNKGDALYSLEKYEEAIACYDNIPPTDKENYYKAQLIKGNALRRLKEYEDAIACYDKIPSTDKENYYNAQYNKGNASLWLKSNEEVKDSFLNYLKSVPNVEEEWHFIGLANAYLKQYEEATTYFVKNGEEAFDIYVLLKNQLDYENTNELVSYMLDEATGDFFNKTLTDGKEGTCTKGKCEKPTCQEQACKKEKHKLYKELYLQILEIVSLLHVNQEAETSFAHYTRKEVIERLLFDESPFRLGSTISSNDPKEGHSLLDYLNMDAHLSKRLDAERAFESPYQAFIACFTFNYNSLNQFRLYGKENKQEATGVSIVVNSSYFSDTASHPISAGGALDKEEIKPLPLYRCIYLDPDMKKVIALGHKDEYAFYINDPNADKKIEPYQKHINNLRVKVEEGLIKLSHMIDDEAYQSLDRVVVGELLLPLRYLVKHAAYKEEQECRMIDIEKLSKENDKVKYENEKEPKNTYHQLYIEYLKMGQHVKKIYFAPHAPHFELFQNTAKRLGHDFHIVRSKHPFIE